MVHVTNTYIALLRGINVGGNSMVNMADLRSAFEELGYQNVKTYINSGNVIFTSVASDQRKLEAAIERALQKSLKLPVRVMVFSLAQMERVIQAIPKRWQTATGEKHDIIFLHHTIDRPDVAKDLKPKPDIEELRYHPGVLLWSVKAESFSKSNIVKLNSMEIYKYMTVRSPGTVQKIYALMSDLAKS